MEIIFAVIVNTACSICKSHDKRGLQRSYHTALSPLSNTPGSPMALCLCILWPSQDAFPALWSDKSTIISFKIKLRNLPVCARQNQWLCPLFSHRIWYLSLKCLILC